MYPCPTGEVKGPRQLQRFRMMPPIALQPKRTATRSAAARSFRSSNPVSGVCRTTGIPAAGRGVAEATWVTKTYTEYWRRTLGATARTIPARGPNVIDLLMIKQTGHL